MFICIYIYVHVDALGDETGSASSEDADGLGDLGLDYDSESDATDGLTRYGSGSDTDESDSKEPSLYPSGHSGSDSDGGDGEPVRTKFPKRSQEESLARTRDIYGENVVNMNVCVNMNVYCVCATAAYSTGPGVIRNYFHRMASADSVLVCAKIYTYVHMYVCTRATV
jgi:hypothetical protein